MSVEVGITSSTVAELFLGPSMEARALNVEQRALIFNPSPECDSLIEYARVLVAGQPASSSHSGLAACIAELAKSNEREGSFELALAGAADQLARDLHDLERNGGGGALTSKAIARALREPLRILGDPLSVEEGERFRSFCLLHDVVRSTPRAQLLAGAVRHELGKAKFARLERIVTEAKGAPVEVESTDAQDRGGDPRHGSI